VQDGPAEHPDPEVERRPYRRSRDWRVYAGGLGRVLLSTGVLVLAFVAYQLWGTGIQAAQAQDALEQEFEEALSAVSTTVASPTTTGVATTSAPAGSTTPTTVPATTAPPTTPAATLPEVREGDALARLEIPRIGVDWIVVAGVRVEDLQKGPGHYPDTPLPGQEGNVAIAGHRTTYGAPFARINELEPGDEIVVSTFTGRFVYRMSEQWIVPPTDASVLDPSPFPVLTLTSCHPKYSARERIIVRAVFDADASSGPLAPAMPGYAGTAASDPATVAPTTPATSEPSVTAPAAAEPGTTADSPVVSSAEASSATTVAAPAQSTSADALEHGWFDDPDAWPQVALWGTAVTLVALGAWGMSRWSRRNWVGAVLGIAPFVVALYFLFENVNRLLPPNL
jgi:sortase A